jgi:hypothetical protein
MHRSSPWLFAILCLMVAGPASAQVIWDMPSVVVPKPKLDSSTVKPRAETWPRLDPGAVLCKTETDLALLAASRRGEQVGPPHCQLIHSPTAIQIEKRMGPGRTQVSVTGQDGLDGWTDAWLPDRAPIIGGKGVSIK